jgi:hypothetical protein
MSVERAGGMQVFSVKISLMGLRNGGPKMQLFLILQHGRAGDWTGATHNAVAGGDQPRR